jgi:hypothetical protein
MRIRSLLVPVLALAFLFSVIVSYTPSLKAAVADELYFYVNRIPTQQDVNSARAITGWWEEFSVGQSDTIQIIEERNESGNVIRTFYRLRQEAGGVSAQWAEGGKDYKDGRYITLNSNTTFGREGGGLLEGSDIGLVNITISNPESQTDEDFEPTLPPSSTDDEEDEQRTCEDLGRLSWLVCPVIELMEGALRALDSQVSELLHVHDRYFTPNDEGNIPLRDAWRGVRNLAIIILLPVMIVMVISTALGFEFISAYTIKKSFPRLIAAAIFIALSWEITTFAVQFTNALGRGIGGIVTSPVGGFDSTNLSNLFGPAEGIGFTAIAIGGLIGLAAFGMLGVLGSLLITLLLIFLAGFLVLVIREMLIVSLIIIAPLAILAWIFPANTKLWSLWRVTLTKLLLLYPLIMLLLGSGRVVASLANDTTSGIIRIALVLGAYIGPYAFIPATFKFASGVLGNLSGVVNNTERGLFDRQKNKRAAIAKEGWNKFGKAEGDTLGARNKFVRNIGQRVGVGTRGRFGFGQRGRADIERMRTSSQAEKMKEPGVQDLLYDDDVRFALMHRNASDAKQGFEHKIRKDLMKKHGDQLRSGEMQQSEFEAKFSERMQQAESAIGSARSIGFTPSTQLAALNFEAPNKSRNFKSNEDMSAMIQKVAADTGVDATRLSENYAYAARQSGRLDLGAAGSDGLDKVLSDKFDTRLLQASTADAWAPIAQRNVELLRNGSEAEKKRAGAQLIAMQESLAGTSESSRNAFIQAMQVSGVQYGTDKSFEVQVAEMSGLTTAQNVQQLAKELRATSSTYGSSIPEEIRNRGSGEIPGQGQFRGMDDS